ncbi:MAG: response regulator, partial [Treponema sp.]|nr:response regulator [Treponema sp.]
MYRILLVDDDPIVISGIKHLIDWKKNNCVIEDTASNGITAQKKLKRLRPDLVICDIAMPGLSGIDLLKYSRKEYPGIVFIMLTNHKDFEFAKESLHQRATGYIVKTDLNPHVLEKALENAIEECEDRKSLHRVAEADKLLNTKEKQTRIHDALISFLYDKPPMSPEKYKVLEGEEMLANFAFALIPLNFALLPQYTGISKEELHRIFEWETEIAEHLASSFFKNSILLPHSPIFEEAANREGRYIDLLLFAWKLNPQSWKSDSEHFHKRL